MNLVDAHHHLIDLTGAAHRYPRLTGPLRRTAYGDDAKLRRDYTPAEHAADAAAMGAVQSVHIEMSGGTRAAALAETCWLEDIGDTGLPAAAAAHVDLAAPDAAEALAEQARHPIVRAVRHITLTSGGLAKVSPDQTPFSDAAWRRGFARLAEHGLVFELQAPPPFAAAAADLAAAFPETSLVLTHCGHPLDRSSAGMAAWRTGLDRLAACANVTVKLSGFWMMEPTSSAADVAALANPVLERFGPHRVMVGSNFPVDRLFVTAATWRRAIDQALGHLDITSRTAILAGTARRVYRLPDPNREREVCA